MFRKFTSRTYCVLPAILFLSLSISVLTMLLSGCSKKKKNEPEQTGSGQPSFTEAIVLQTDSTEWHVQIFKEHLLYSEAVAVKLPAPWVIPSREDAAILRQLSYPSEERFITCDGYTFGMPSASVSKAGSKTQYSVLGLWRRTTTIDVPF